MPRRIKALLDGAPPWLKPHLVIVDGTQTMAEEVTDTAGKVSTTTISVVRYDPAVAFGQFALAGWDDNEAGTSSKSSSVPAKIRKSARRNTMSTGPG
jgi:hypothetical protein